jgi:hypothetical protein
MKIPTSLLLLTISLSPALLADENGLNADALRRASSLKTAQAAFETTHSIAQRGTDLSSVSNSAALVEAHGTHLSSDSANAAMQSRNVPSSLTSVRLSELRESGLERSNPQNSADPGRVSK